VLACIQRIYGLPGMEIGRRGNHKKLKALVFQEAFPVCERLDSVLLLGKFQARPRRIEAGGQLKAPKPGKLPAKTFSATYELEYGTDTIEIHADAIRPRAKVLMIDDLLATGGTMAAACDLVKRLGGDIVGVAFVVELCFLHGGEKLTGYDLRSLIKVEE